MREKGICGGDEDDLAAGLVHEAEDGLHGIGAYKVGLVDKEQVKVLSAEPSRGGRESDEAGAGVEGDGV